MRTLTLLAAILLLALQAQAEPLLEKAEDALEQQQLQEEDQDVAIYFAGAERSGLQSPDENLQTGSLYSTAGEPEQLHPLRSKPGQLRTVHARPRPRPALGALCLDPSPGQDPDPGEYRPSSLEERASKKPDLKLQK